MNIANFLKQAAHPNHPALIFPHGRKKVITFSELDEWSSRLAFGMNAKGISAGDRVIVLAPISLMLYAGLIALFKIGAVAVFLDPQTTIRQLNDAIKVADARAIIASQKISLLRFFLPALQQIPYFFSINSLNKLTNSDSLKENFIADKDSPALITFTGGSTTTSPRGVLRTHYLLGKQHDALKNNLPMQNGDVDLPAFPVVTLHNLASGITSVIPDFPFRKPNAVKPEKILRQIRQYKITTASGSPAYWNKIAKYCLKNHISLNLRRIVTGGAVTSPILLQQLKQVAPQAEIINLYGSSEAEPVAKISVEDLTDEKIMLIKTGAGIPLGRSASQIQVRIWDEYHHELPLNQIGEIWVCGEHVAREYFANPQANAAYKYFDVDKNLWHCMGDVGYKDEEGCLWLVGRVNTVVQRAGEKLYPVQIEKVAEQFNFVKRAALIGIPNVNLNETAELWIELNDDVSLPEYWQTEIFSVIAKCGWTIDKIQLIKKMPMDARHNARIDYQVLKRMALKQ